MKLRLYMVSCALIGLSACSSLNPFSKTEARDPPAPLVPIQASLPVKPVWSVPLPGGAPDGVGPVRVERAIYAASADGTVVRVDVDTGQSTWRTKLDQPISAGLGSDGTTTAVGTAKGDVIALDGAGKIKWRALVSSQVLTPPVVGEGLVVVRSADHRIFAFDAQTGARRWIYQRQVPALTLRSPAQLTLANGMVLAGFPGGKLVAIASNTGTVRWEAVVTYPKGATELERIADVVGSPEVFEREVCAVSFQGRIACFSTDNGEPTWAREFSGTNGLSMDARFVFASNEHSLLFAFSRERGANLWKQDQFQNRGLSAPVSVGDTIVVADAQGYIHWLAREDGRYLARVATDGGVIRAAPIALDKSLIVQTEKGGLYAFVTQ